MKVIFKQDVRGAGRRYDVKNVADGYANNFLIPKKLVEYAGPEAVKKAEILKSAALAEIEIREKLTEKQIEMLKGVKIILNKKSSEKGHLFEKIHPEEISGALKDQAKVEISPEFLVIDEPIKEIGEHKVSAQTGKILATFLVIVEPSK